MKMKFPLPHNHSRRAAALARTLFVLLALATLFYIFAPRALHRTFMAVAQPFWLVKKQFGDAIRDAFSLAGDMIEQRRAYERVSRELLEAQTALVSLEEYKKENAELRKILGKPDAARNVPAFIVAKPNQSLYDTLIVDVGEHAGVKAGDVLAVGDFALGTIREVYPAHSKAVLFSTAGEKTPVILGEGIHTEARGRGNGNFVVELPKEISVAVGERVIRSGTTRTLLGIIQHIEATETGSFQRILFALPVNPNSVERVEIIRI